jgi:large subunit ribosomal protein L17
MRHRKAKYKLGMNSAHREAMMRNMVTSLLEHESIVTTEARAKALRGLADKMITLGKRGDLHARRQALAVIRSKRTTKRLFDDIAPRFAQREGGYTRVIKKGFRIGDCAPMAIIELVEKSEEKAQKKTKPAEETKGLRGKISDALKSK